MRKPMVLVACEESQAVTIEMRKIGIEAYSCDIIDCSGGHPEWHIKWDALPLVNGNCSFMTCDGELHRIDGEWDMVIAFPPCTHLATSGARHFERKRNDGIQESAILFFCAFLVANCKRIVIENPLGIMSGGEYIKTYYPDISRQYNVPRPFDQTIQPWWFAESENDSENYHEKTTCLWEKGVPPLKRPMLDIISPQKFVTSSGKSFPAWYSKTSLRGKGNRQTVRSKTFPGIAKAMAEQWGKPLLRELMIEAETERPVL